MIWDCLAAAATGKIVRTDDTMDPAMNQAVLNENVLPLESWVYIGAGYSNKTMIRCFKANPQKSGFETKFQVLEWPRQNSDLNPIEDLWFKLKMAVHTRNPSNIKQL